MALRCIPNLVPKSGVRAVVVEWATDYVLIGDDDHVELVSVKHRDPGQGDWSRARLATENVFRDLHAVWREMGERGDYVFESNAGLDRTLAPYRSPSALTAQALAWMAKHLAAPQQEVRRFLSQLILRQDVLPNRDYIDEVALERMRTVLEMLHLDPRQGQECYAALVALVTEASIERPLRGPERIAHLAGTMRAMLGPRPDRQVLRLSDLREHVAAVARRAPRRSAGLPEARLAPDPLFTGRSQELEKLDQLLPGGTQQPLAPVVLTGLTGIGKTAIALQFAATRQSATTHCFVIPAHSRTTLLSGVFALLGADPQPGGPMASEDAVGPLAVTAQVPLMPDDPSLVLIVDGVTDPDTLNDVVPRRTRTRVLITTTSRHLDDAFEHIEIAGLPPTDSLAYLRAVLPEASSEPLDEIVDYFDGHPLALAQCANLCRSQGLQPAAYLDRLRRNPARMVELGRARGHPQAAGQAIADALDTAASQQPAAYALASILAWLAPSPLPESLIDHVADIYSSERTERPAPRWRQTRPRPRPAQGQNPLLSLGDTFARDQAIGALHQLSLLTRRADGLVMHPLVQTVMRDRIAPPDRVAWLEAAMALLMVRLAPTLGADPDNARLVPHAAALAQFIADYQPHPFPSAMIQLWLGQHHLALGAFDSARQHLDSALTHAQDPQAGDDVAFICLRYLTMLNLSCGQVEQAIETTRQWQRRAQSSDDSTQAFQAARHRLRVLIGAQRYRDAEAALAECDRILPVGRQPLRQQIIHHSIVAELEDGAGRLESALQHSLRGLELVERLGAGREDHLAYLHHQIGTYLRGLGRPEDAIGHQRKAIAAMRTMADGGMTSIPTLQGLAMTLMDLGRLDDAEAPVEEGLAISSRNRESTSAHGIMLAAAARLAMERGAYTEALAMFDEAIALLESGGDPTRGDTAVAWVNCGTAHLALRHADKAVDAFRRARALDVEVHGESHPEVLTDDSFLASALATAGDLESARETLERCFSLVQRGNAAGRLVRTRILALGFYLDSPP